VLGADVVVGYLGAPDSRPGSAPAVSELHDLVARKLTNKQWMAEFDAEARTPEGPSGWARDRVQHAVASAMAKDQAFATRVRSILEGMGARA
jgi:hypothetical protein